jgi:hypothetical protein
MITSRVGHGLIYAGDTPLALTIVVEQTGPMQITVRAGAFTSTGQARIRPYVPEAHDAMIEAGLAELLPDGARVRLWILGADGVPVARARTFVLVEDQVIDLASDPTRPVAYDVDLVTDGLIADVLVKRKVVGVEEYGAPPAGWTKVHELLFEFVLPPGCADITPIEIRALSVLPGFPLGTGPDDWTMQRGGA